MRGDLRWGYGKAFLLHFIIWFAVLYFFLTLFQSKFVIRLVDCEMVIDGWMGWVTYLLLIFFASLWIRLYLGVMGVELSSICL